MSEKDSTLSQYFPAFVLHVGKYVVLYGGIACAIYTLKDLGVSWETGKLEMIYDAKSIAISIGILIFSVALSRTLSILNKKTYGEAVIGDITSMFRTVFMVVFGLVGGILGAFMGYAIGMSLFDSGLAGGIAATIGGIAGFVMALSNF
ncbi:MAG: hypothetical protein LBF38_05570 [Deltaproteobacteria bacterium]|jgi:hypothetical protein|nr:hypothetical protein [Deltaproteobacteria bacterium]